MEGYVYSITNIGNGKQYIGSTVNYKKRKRAHLNGLKGSYHDNRLLQQDFDNYGEDSFVFEVICKTESEEERFRIEANLIQKFKTFEFDNGYNLSMDGRGKYILTEEIREKMRQNTIGENNPFYGKSHTEESKALISEKSKQRTGSKNPFYGKRHTEESRDKIRKTIQKKVELGWDSPQKGVPKTKEAIRNNTLAQPTRIGVHAEGKDYISLSACSKDLGIHRATIKRRTENPDYPNYYYLNK